KKEFSKEYILTKMEEQWGKNNRETKHKGVEVGKSLGALGLAAVSFVPFVGTVSMSAVVMSEERENFRKILPSIIESHAIELRNQIQNNTKNHARQLTGLRDHIIRNEQNHQDEITRKDTE